MTDRIIAIGDIHGCAKALATLLKAIQPAQEDTLVFLGDYIDRGPDSRGVVEQVVALAGRCTVVPLLGNHEEMVLAALEGQSELDFWLKFGGMEALASYGYGGGRGIRPGALRGILPAEHLEFFKGCRDYYEAVRHVFVHAYYDPHLPLHQQKWGGLRWASLPPVPGALPAAEQGVRASDRLQRGHDPAQHDPPDGPPARPCENQRDTIDASGKPKETTQLAF